MHVSEFPSSEAEFRARFADNDRCREYLARLKWPEGFRCAHCAGDRAYFLPSKSPPENRRPPSSPRKNPTRHRSLTIMETHLVALNTRGRSSTLAIRRMAG